MLQRDGGKSQGEACANDKQKCSANQLMPAVPAGRTAPEYGAPCFQAIKQLLPTFDDPVRG